MQRASSLTHRGAKIHYRRSGGGPTLLFLKSEDSLPENADFIQALTSEFDVVIPDHPGFGQSDTPDWFKGIGDVAYFYLDFLEQLDLTQVHLVGCSLGGWIAAEIAIRNCSRLAGLTLVAPFGVRRRGTPFGDIFMWTPEENIRHRLFDPALADRLLATVQARSAEEATSDLKDRYATARLCWHPRFHNPELERWLHRIDRPVQLLWGDSDRVVPRAIAEVWQERLPQARLTTIERCGHLPHLEHPKAAAETIRSFVREACA